MDGLAVVRAEGSVAAGEKGKAANGAKAGNRPGQKSGKVVTGNRLLDKKLTADKPKPAPKPEVRIFDTHFPGHEL